MIIVAVAISSIYTANAQVAINIDGTDPNPSAMLDVKNTNKGFLPPRMTTAQMNDITSPPASLMIYNTTINSPAFFNGTEWIAALNRDGKACESILYDGQTYQSIFIGFQCWMAENLNYETPHSWWYGDSSANGDKYGRLYTWEAALTACPTDWHLPSDDEWKALEMHLGMSQSQADIEGVRGTIQGKKLKSLHHWHNYGNGNDAVNFTGLPGGYLVDEGIFDNLTVGGYWWTATGDGPNDAWYRYMYWDITTVIRYSYWKNQGGFSVRCVRDY